MKKIPFLFLSFQSFDLIVFTEDQENGLFLFVWFGFDLCSFWENDEDGREFKVIRRSEVEEDWKIEELSSNLYTTFYLLDLWP